MIASTSTILHLCQVRHGDPQRPPAVPVQAGGHLGLLAAPRQVARPPHLVPIPRLRDLRPVRARPRHLGLAPHVS